MPSESIPRILRGAICSPPASFAPMRATGTTWPSATLVAAVAMSSGVPSPTSIVQRLRRSALGCFASLVIRPATTLVSSSRASTSSTGKPSVARRATIASASSGSVT